MSRLLPLFPLQVVALPGAAIPLHIFEERYREMVGEAETAGSEFGIVLVKEEGLVNAGCTVVVENVSERYPDGRFDVIVRGKRRFMLLELNRELAYLRGEVEYFEDDEWTPVSAELRNEALSCARLIDTGEANPDHPFLSFQLAQGIEDPDFKHLLLCSRSESERLNQFIGFVRDYVPRRDYAAKMRALAPTNGKGHKRADS